MEKKKYYVCWLYLPSQRKYFQILLDNKMTIPHPLHAHPPLYAILTFLLSLSLSLSLPHYPPHLLEKWHYLLPSDINFFQFSLLLLYLFTSSNSKQSSLFRKLEQKKRNFLYHQNRVIYVLLRTLLCCQQIRSCYAVASDTTNNAISDQSSMSIKHIKRVLQVCVCGVSGTREG